MTAIGFATAADAGTIDVIFTGGCSGGISGGGTVCTGSSGDIVTADVVLNTVVGDTPMGGFGSGYQISLSYAGAAGPVNPLNTPPASWIPAAVSVDDGVSFVQSAFNGFDLLGFSSLGAPASVPIGSMTLNLDGLAGLVSPNLAGAGDGMVGFGGGTVDGEYTFNSGQIVVPEPTTAMLLSLGVAGLAMRRRWPY